MIVLELDNTSFPECESEFSSYGLLHKHFFKKDICIISYSCEIFIYANSDHMLFTVQSKAKVKK